MTNDYVLKGTTKCHNKDCRYCLAEFYVSWLGDRTKVVCPKCGFVDEYTSEE